LVLAFPPIWAVRFSTYLLGSSSGASILLLCPISANWAGGGDDRSGGRRPTSLMLFVKVSVNFVHCARVRSAKTTQLGAKWEWSVSWILEAEWLLCNDWAKWAHCPVGSHGMHCARIGAHWIPHGWHCLRIGRATPEI
jgi:hypothetical protein